MKLLLSFFCFTILSTQCISKKSSHQKRDFITEEVVFIYTYYSRGFYKEHQLSSEKMITYHDGNKTKFTEKTVIPMDWAKSLDLLIKLDLKRFENLEAPSHFRKTDRVPYAELTLKINNTAFRSLSFDHGNPPKQIKALITQLLYMSEGDVIQK